MSLSAGPRTLPERDPEVGELVQVRSRCWLVEEVIPSPKPRQSSKRGNREKPWRYRRPDDVRDEVLARLLELNAERAREEARSGAGQRRSKKGAAASAQRRLFE